MLLRVTPGVVYVPLSLAAVSFGIFLSRVAPHAMNEQELAQAQPVTLENEQHHAVTLEVQPAERDKARPGTHSTSIWEQMAASDILGLE